MQVPLRGKKSTSVQINVVIQLAVLTDMHFTGISNVYC